MEAINATDVRKEWSSVVDTVVREKPLFIKRTRDYLVMSDTNTIELLLETYEFEAERYLEDDGSVTIALKNIDLIENGKDDNDAKKSLVMSMIDYAKDYYDNFAVWSKAPNRRAHIPYVLRILLINDADRLGEMIVCQDGAN